MNDGCMHGLTRTRGLRCWGQQRDHVRARRTAGHWCVGAGRSCPRCDADQSCARSGAEVARKLRIVFVIDRQRLVGAESAHFDDGEAHACGQSRAHADAPPRGPRRGLPYDPSVADRREASSPLTAGQGTAASGSGSELIDRHRRAHEARQLAAYPWLPLIGDRRGVATVGVFRSAPRSDVSDVLHPAALRCSSE